MKTKVLLLMASALMLSACAFNIHLTPRPGPLEEQIVEGEGPKKILILDISGLISEKSRSRGFGAAAPSLQSNIREELLMAAADPEIAGVVLRINTPGGTVSASDAIYQEVKEFRRSTHRPVYASITAMGTSGGYYIASAADRIEAHPTAITGSIGVLALKLNIQGLMQKVGVDDKTYTSGALKGMFSPFRPDTPEERKIIQAIIDSFHERFLSVAHEGRGGRLSMDALKALADGRPYTAQQALDAGLIDAIAYLPETIERMKTALGLADASVVVYGTPGEYSGSVYATQISGAGKIAGLDALGPAGLGQGAFGADGLFELGGPEFMYIWPGI